LIFRFLSYSPPSKEGNKGWLKKLFLRYKKHPPLQEPKVGEVGVLGKTKKYESPIDRSS
jgi:hypothetical protein